MADELVCGCRLGRGRGPPFCAQPRRRRFRHRGRQGGQRLAAGVGRRRSATTSSGPELRLRAEVGPTGELQMLVMTRAADDAARATGVRRIHRRHADAHGRRHCPRRCAGWCCTPKVPRSELGLLRERFGALSNFPRAALSWLDRPLVDRLDTSPAWLPAEQALVLVVQRGRLTLRCGLPQPALPALQGALGLLDAALAAARRVGDELAQGRFGDERPSTWGPPSAMPPAEEPAG